METFCYSNSCRGDFDRLSLDNLVQIRMVSLIQRFENGQRKKNGRFDLDYIDLVISPGPCTPVFGQIQNIISFIMKKLY
jgi:anthranilate/para-aminobenzoate synthase component II